MSHTSYHVALVLALTASACSTLTAPPGPEPGLTDTPTATTTAAATQSVAVASAKPAPTPTMPAAPPTLVPPPSASAPQWPEVKELKIETLVAAKKGAQKVKEGEVANVLYKGMFLDGKEFDSSMKHGNKPLPVTVGRGGVIDGFMKGVTGMSVGEKRKVTIPYLQAYGERGQPPTIPPKTPLVFELELQSITVPGQPK